MTDTAHVPEGDGVNRPEGAQPQPSVGANPQPSMQPQASAAPQGAQPSAHAQQAENPQRPQQPPSPMHGYGYAQTSYTQPPYGYAQAAYASAPVAPVKQKSGKGGWIALGIILFAIVFTFTIGALSCSYTMSSLTSGAGVLADMSDELVTSGDSIGVIDMSGTIQYDGSACSPEGLRDLLREAEENSDIKAVVLRVDSGGGTATAGEEMAAYVREFSKPVVVSSASMNCSAAYEISSQADYIFVNETTAIGSIGTVMQVQDISGLLDMLGISIDNIASADSKDSSYGTRPLTEDERAYYQNLVNEINEAFIDNVAEGRGMDIETVRELATGMQFSGTTAVENGLADEVGIYDDALDKAAELGGIESGRYDVVTLTGSMGDLRGLLDLLGAETGSNAAGDATRAASVEELVELLKKEGVVS